MSLSAQSEKDDFAKPVHTLILDSSPLLLNEPGISTLLANGHVLVTTPSVLAEIRGEEARNRIETLYKPFLTVQSPKPESLRLVKDFARRTGDAGVLSQTDFEILALAYEIECERNGGDWRLRTTPGQKRLNGKPPVKAEDELCETKGDDTEAIDKTTERSEGQDGISPSDPSVGSLEIQGEVSPSEDFREELQDVSETREDQGQVLRTQDELVDVGPGTEVVVDGDSDDSEGGWITPSNIKKKQAQDDTASSKTKSEVKHLQVATMTGDFAMQNVLLQMNLNLLSTKTCKRVSQIKQYILRCHACFATTKDMSKQFCTRCGKPTLTRVSCSTNDKGEVKLHLKSNMQWNNRGNVFSIPKPSHGSSNQKWQGPKQGGGKQGWGTDLVLAEDQKEYVRAMSSMKRTKEKDLMDQDLLPGILTGERHNAAGRPRVGAGRNVNSRKR